MASTLMAVDRGEEAAGGGSGPSASRLARAAFPWVLLDPVGEGRGGVVFKARHRETGILAALKVDRIDPAVALREAALIARVARRWGPKLLDLGVVPEGGGPLPSGSRFLATEWIEGARLTPSKVAAPELVAAIVAHGVGRALQELHAMGVRHGDVKADNVVLAPSAPLRDVASDRGCTLIDLGLAGEVARDPLLGATPRYLAPEVRASPDGPGPAADLFALGVLLAEVLDPAVARASDPSEAMAAWSSAPSEPAEWAQALVAQAPGGRPSAAWVASRAARWLGLRQDEEEEARAREALVRRTYLAVRARELRPKATISSDVRGAPRAWLEEVLPWADKLGIAASTTETALGPLRPLARARWLVALVGPVASAWPLGLDAGADDELAARLLRLARVAPPTAWTLDEVSGRGVERSPVPQIDEPLSRVAWLSRELGKPRPDARALPLAEEEVRSGAAPNLIALDLAGALVRAGELGRAWAAISRAHGDDADALRAEIARRRGDIEACRRACERLSASKGPEARARARATLARLAWDAGDLAAAERHVEGLHGPAGAEIRALVAYKRGEHEAGLQIVTEALAEVRDTEASARLEATRGMLEHARGDAHASLQAFARAVDLATRTGAVVEEATYLTGEAAAAVAAGSVSRALASATRAALLWERLDRKGSAARAWLSRAGALAAMAAVHAADEAADEAQAAAVQSGDRRAYSFARWARVESRPPGDEIARREAVAAYEELAELGFPEDGYRASARLLVWAPDGIDDARIAAIDDAIAAASAPSRWEWWGARAASTLRGRRVGSPSRVLTALVALVDVGAPLEARGPALDAGARLAKELGDGAVARRLEEARREAARELRRGAPPSLRASLGDIGWARESSEDTAAVTLAADQIAQLGSIVRALGARDRLRPLLEQALDALVLWSGVERGLLLLRAPDGKLVPRAARNLARRDLDGEQLVLSQGIARRALETREAVVATDAFSSLGELHASVHALGLRSVLAVPLLARGEALGVVYLDDRARRGAFGPRELAWVELVASQAAVAIADARDQVLLKRAVRRAERARAALEATLSERDVELDATRAELHLTRDGIETRYRYDTIAGRSEPMRKMLELLDRVTTSDVPVLLVGESGTGKELVARALHANGPRARRPFVSENCASVPESLLESALFGHVKGAFTGAGSTRAGLFDVADGGTLLLDEIGEMPLAMQAKLLRVLQDGEIRPVGGDRIRRVDVRVVGATHRDLEAMVASGTFREDLFYRLNVISIRIPPLRERAEDIPLLVRHMLDKHSPGRPVKVTRAAMEKLIRFPWPGNVRQLENEVRRAVVLADESAGRIDVSELSPDVVRGGPSAARGAGFDLRSRVDALETDLVREALERTGGNQSRAAQLLGVSRFGLQKMMKRLGLEGRPRGAEGGPRRGSR